MGQNQAPLHAQTNPGSKSFQHVRNGPRSDLKGSWSVLLPRKREVKALPRGTLPFYLQLQYFLSQIRQAYDRCLGFFVLLNF